MKRRKIYRIIGLTFWALVSGGVLALLISGVDARDQQLCREVRISISGGKGPLFLYENDIERVVSDLQGRLVGTSIAAFRMGQIEDSLKNIPWIADADLFFDNMGTLEVHVTERDPIARIFTASGESFYLDNNLVCMPLHSGYVSRKPVFTGFPGNRQYLTGEDSVLLAEIRDLGRYILADSFWIAQLEQVNYNEDGTFTLVPKVGEHVVQFGRGLDIDRKFRNLFIFYRDVMGKVGAAYYDKIYLGFNGQVVASRRNSVDATAMSTIHIQENQQQDSLKAVSAVQQTEISKRKNKQP